MTAPANDAFADAQELLPVAAGSVPGVDVTDATRETGEPNWLADPGVFGTVWFSWTCPDPAPASVRFAARSQTDPQSLCDTALAVYTGSDVASLVEVATSDDAYGRDSRVTFVPTASVVYYVQATAWVYDDEVGGPFTVAWEAPPPDAPANDMFAGRLAIGGLNGEADATALQVASTEAGEYTAGLTGVSDWYAWTVPDPAPDQVTFAFDWTGQPDTNGGGQLACYVPGSTPPASGDQIRRTDVIAHEGTVEVTLVPSTDSLAAGDVVYVQRRIGVDTYGSASGLRWTSAEALPTPDDQDELEQTVWTDLEDGTDVPADVTGDVLPSTLFPGATP